MVAQVADDSATPYIVPSAGTLTAWQVDTQFATAGAPATLVVLRSTGGFGYTVVGADTQTLPAPSGVATFTIPAPIAVQSGDILGLWVADELLACYYQFGSTPAANALIALESATPPTAGQSLVSTDYSDAGYRLNLAATLTPPPTPAAPPKKKKCKKKKKRSAESAKKKCKKKKKG